MCRDLGIGHLTIPDRQNQNVHKKSVTDRETEAQTHCVPCKVTRSAVT